MSRSSGVDSDPSLKRDIGFFGSAFLAFNGVVGAGIFALPAVLFIAFGDFSPWLFPVFGTCILVIAWPLADLAGRFRTTGGPVAYADAAFGPAAAFQVGWLFWLGRVAAIAANGNVFVAYAAIFWPELGSGIGRTATLCILIGGLTAINVFGVRRAVRLLDLLTFAKALPLIILALGAIALNTDAIGLPSGPPPITVVEANALLILYAFVGFENTLVPAGETRNPERTIPRAMLMTIAATTALYFLIQFAYIAASPADIGTAAPLVALGTEVFGGVGGVILTLAALASLTGNLTSSSISTPRITFALAREGSLPGWFGRVSASYKTPANSILFLGAAALALAITGSFVWLAVIGTLARLIVYLTSFAALPRIRRQAGEPAVSGPLGALILLTASLICVWGLLQAGQSAWQTLAVCVIAGTMLYVAARYGRNLNATIKRPAGP